MFLTINLISITIAYFIIYLIVKFINNIIINFIVLFHNYLVALVFITLFLFIP